MHICRSNYNQKFDDIQSNWGMVIRPSIVIYTMWIPSMGWMMIRCSCRPLFFLNMGLSNEGPQPKELQDPKAGTFDWENDDKTGYWVQCFRYFQTPCVRNPYRESEVDEEV